MNNGCSSPEPNSTQGCPTLLGDRCIKYTGPNYTGLGILTGDTLAKDLIIILDKLTEILNQGEIELDSITPNCAFVQNALANKDSKLSTIVQAILDSLCNLNDKIEAVDAKIEPPFSFNTNCLTITGESTRNKIIQALIDKVCQNTQQLDNITEEIGDTEDIFTNIEQIIGNTVLSMLSSCQGGVVKTGSGATAAISFNAQVPIGTYLFGKWPVSAFDSTGKGLPSAGLCGYAMCNGNNGTDDIRGQKLAMATNLPGPALLPFVSAGSDLDIPTNIGSRKGQYKITLNSTQIPNHTHNTTVTDPGHSHMGVSVYHGGSGADPISDQLFERDSRPPNLFRSPAATSTSTTGITVNITGVTGGSGQSHENRDPTLYVNCIQRIS